MALTLKRGQPLKPAIMICYGKPGIGKTTFACNPALKPIVVQTEDGMIAPYLRDVPTFGVLDTYEKVLESFTYIFEHAHTEGWKTVVIDSIDRLDPLVVDYTCRMNNWKKLEDGAYGRGKIAWRDEWRNFMTSLITLRNELDISVIMLGHCKATRVTPPDSEPYNQYSLTLPEDVARLLVGDSDIVGFATYPVTTIANADQGFGKKVTRAITQQPRLWLQETGSHIAKNRYGAPAWIPFDFYQLAQYVPTWSALVPQELAQPANAAPNGAATNV